MSYSVPKSVTYTRTLGTANTTWAITPFPGCTQCRVQSINASVTTVYNVATAKVTVGVTNNLDVAGSLTLGTTAGGSAIGFTINKNVNPLVPMIDISGAAAAAAISSFQQAVVANGPVLITFNAGGAASGAAIADITLDWF